MIKSGNNTYTIKSLPVVVKEHIPELKSVAKIRIKRTIEKRLTVNPLGFCLATNKIPSPLLQLDPTNMKPETKTFLYVVFL